jgi:thiamine-phosphate pyrophosphorylase
MPSLDFRILLVTDRHQTQGRSLSTMLAQAVAGGVRAIQVRERDLSTRELLRLTQEIRTHTGLHAVQLIMNDRVDLVLALELDGVHLRANSMPTAVARRLLGAQRLIGISAHSLAEVRQANEEGADYVVYGPIFETPSKRAFGPPLGLDALESACRASRVPIFAIGGITRDRVQDVYRRGASGIAVIGAILNQENVVSAAKELCADSEK